MARKKTSKLRLFGKKTIKLAKSNDGECLRHIEEADGRLSTVKKMRLRLNRLIGDANCDTQQKEWLAARAVALVTYLESQEVKLMEDEPIVWQTYLQAVRTLADILNKLGLDKAGKGAKQLADYLIDIKSKKKKA